MRTVLSWLAGVWAVLAMVPAVAAAAPAAVPVSCPEAAGAQARCGTVTVPLDRRNAALGTIGIGYELHPHSGTGPARGTIVTSIGGPGNANTTARDLWLAQFGPLLDRWDLLLVDHRGIGRSEAIDCPALQHVRGDQAAAAAACGASLGATANLYGSGDVADDIDDVRAALGIAKLDYYGDSYGAVDVRAYALRHPDHLRSAILDSPYVPGDDTFLREFPRWAAKVQVTTCRRTPSCAAASPHPARTLAWLTHRLRTHPFSAVARAADGTARRVRVDETTILGLLYNDNFGPFPFLNQGELTAAAQSLRHGDRAPLLRLVAESPVPTDFGDPAAGTSVGADYAVYCADSAFAWDEQASVATRRAQYAAAVRALPSGATAPFSVRSWTAFVKQQPVALAPAADACISWPAPTAPNPPFAPGTRFPDVPALILNSELDLIPLQDATGIRHLFPRASFVRIGNAGHVTGWWNPCSAAIERRFVATLETGDTSCAADPRGAFHSPGAPATRFVPFHGVRAFPLRAADGPPARRAAGHADASTRLERQVAQAGWSAVDDAVIRSLRIAGDRGRGLRGGRYAIRRGKARTVIRLRGVRFAGDVAVSGRAILRTASNRVTARVSVAAGRGRGGTLTARGVLFVPRRPYASLRGRLGGRDVDLRALVN